MTGGSSTSDREILRSIYPQLRRFAAVVGPAEVAPDDLVHDALVRVMAKRSLGSLDHPIAYLRRAILSQASNERRRLGRRRKALLRLVSEVEAVDVYPHDLGDLAALEPRVRAVLYLREVEGYGYAAIAEALGLTEANTRQTLHRAKRRLRDHLETAS